MKQIPSKERFIDVENLLCVLHVPKSIGVYREVCEQIAFGKQVFPVRRMDASIPADRPRYDQLGPYC